MDYNKLIRYCDLKLQQKKIEEEMEELRKDIVAIHPESAELEIQQYTLKIVYQEKKAFDEERLFAALPDPELWKHISKADSSKISALLKAKIITEDMLEGTYTASRVPYLYVHKS
jgi:hypothetical protein